MTMGSLAKQLSLIVGQAFEDAGLPVELGDVRVSDRPDLAQFQCNGAMAASKIARKNPREIANDITQSLAENPVFAKLEIAGPGFINITMTDEYIQNYLATTMQEERN